VSAGARRRRAARLWTCVAASAIAAASGCAAHRGAPVTPVAAPTAACPGATERSAVEAICARDGAVRALQARFRSTVRAGDRTREAEGVLLLQGPGAVRVKLFTLAGLTVYDALWVGDARAVEGAVSLPLEAKSFRVRLRPGEPVPDPTVGVSLALWALWQQRCAEPPAQVADRPGRFELDPATAQAARREVAVGNGEVVEELVVRPAAPGAPEDAVAARYADPDCTLRFPLPRRIEMSAPAQGWRAEVKILAIDEDPELDPRLFVLPDAGHEDAAS